MQVRVVVGHARHNAPLLRRQHDGRLHGFLLLHRYLPRLLLRMFTISACSSCSCSCPPSRRRRRLAPRLLPLHGLLLLPGERVLVAHGGPVCEVQAVGRGVGREEGEADHELVEVAPLDAQKEAQDRAERAVLVPRQVAVEILLVCPPLAPASLLKQLILAHLQGGAPREVGPIQGMLGAPVTRHLTARRVGSRQRQRQRHQARLPRGLGSRTRRREGLVDVM